MVLKKSNCDQLPGGIAMVGAVTQCNRTGPAGAGCPSGDEAGKWFQVIRSNASVASPRTGTGCIGQASSTQVDDDMPAFSKRPQEWLVQVSGLSCRQSAVRVNLRLDMWVALPRSQRGFP